MTSIWRKFKLSFVNSMIDAWKKNTGITRTQGAGSEYICDLCYTDHRRNSEISAWDLIICRTLDGTKAIANLNFNQDKLNRKQLIGLAKGLKCQYGEIHLQAVHSSEITGASSRGGDSHMEWTGMLAVSIRGENFGFWSRLGCSEQNVIIFSRQGLV